MAYFIVALAIFFYMSTVTFISAFMTLRNLLELLPFLKPVVDIPALKTMLEAYLAQIALLFFLAILPKLLMCMSKLEGILT